MERIGTILRRAMLDPEGLIARQNRRRRGDGLTDRATGSRADADFGEEIEAIDPCREEGSRGGEAPAVGAAVSAKPRRPGGGNPAERKLKLVSTSRGPGAIAANPQRAKGLPRPAPGLRLVLVSGGGVHATSATMRGFAETASA